MSSLPENYQNEILNVTMGNRRQYRVIDNNNGTISLIDVTVYDREGSIFNADDINAITHQVNLNLNSINNIIQSLPANFVLGVKGNSESSYRYGNVNITADNIGTYSKAEIERLISTVGGMHFELVNSLPTDNISTSTIYLVPSSSPSVDNQKDEYIYIENVTVTDITSSSSIYNTPNDFPSVGQSGIYYIAENYGYGGLVYLYDDTQPSSQYAYYPEPDYPDAEFVTSLPLVYKHNTLYVTTSDNKVYKPLITGEWEQIGSTAVDLSNYYTKTQIDSGATITVNELRTLT